MTGQRLFSCLVPTQIRLPQTAQDDPRVGSLLRQAPLAEFPGEARWALVGFPSDEGVRRNGGREGAAHAPDEIRRWLYRLTPDAEQNASHAHCLQSCVDLGNVRCDGKLSENQERLGVVVGEILQAGVLPVVLGGGHETAYGHFLGHVATGHSVGILNLDAHADVRPLIDGRSHSGSPFRQALEHPSDLCRHYAVLGLARHSVAASHLEYLRQQRAEWAWCDETDVARVRRQLAASSDRLMVTIDMDVLDQRHAPGVSAPTAAGLGAEVWLEMMELLGQNVRVRSLDLVEVNPKLDFDSATTRLAALGLWRFTRGLARRAT